VDPLLIEVIVGHDRFVAGHTKYVLEYYGTLLTSRGITLGTNSKFVILDEVTVVVSYIALTFYA
jgi:hypothetical protein